MKVTAKDWDENNIDALLFAYLERELPEEEASQLEERIALDPALQSELEHWKESFLVQNFYNTQTLEENLLQEEVKPVHSSASTFIFVLALVASVFSFLPLSPEEETDMSLLPVKMPESRLVVETENILIAEPGNDRPSIQLITPVSQERYITKPVSRQPLHKKIRVDNLPAPSLILVETRSGEYNIAVPEAKMKRLIAKKIFVKRPPTRKERRKIQQIKEKALQQRKANEFLKGHIPYVVPLNTNNF